MKRKGIAVRKTITGLALFSVAIFGVSGCADGVGPKSREVNMPAPILANERKPAVNENADAILYLPLGEDVLMPQTEASAALPSKIIGPFELRDETLGGALQLILDGTNTPVAFETDKASTVSITVTNLKGSMDVVVREVCSLANMYCSYQNGILVVKDKEIFTVTVPPIGASTDTGALLQNISTAVGSITGESPVTDASTRTIVYRATQRTAEMARRYFQRLRTNTAMIVFETYIWEVSLDSGNSTGIRWSTFDQIGRFHIGLNLAGDTSADIGTPVSIGLPTTGIGMNFGTADVFKFISSYGAVKTISQPQVTVLSGSTATLRISDKQNFVASLSKTTTDGGTTTVSTTTDSVNSGFTLTIGSNWDNATVYSNISILLQELRSIDTFKENPDAVVQLPKTTERELKTQLRTRPGDMMLIAGLVREQDKLDKEGLGFKMPFIPTSKTTQTSNTELVFLLKPRVVVFTTKDDAPHSGPPLAAKPLAAVLPEPNIEAMPPIVMTPSVSTLAGTDSELFVGAPVDSSSPLNQGPLTPAPDLDTSSVDIAPLAEAVPLKEEVKVNTKKASDPSIIVNYDVLGH